MIRDLGAAWLWALHARTPEGEVLTFGKAYHLNPCADGLDGFGPLFGAAYRLATGKARNSDGWRADPLVSIYL